MAKYTKALLGAIILVAALLVAILGALAGAHLPHANPRMGCAVPTALMYPPAPSGGLGFVNWTVPTGTDALTFLTNVHKVASDTFVQFFDGKINGVPQYFGLQEINGHGLAIASRFGDATTSYVHPTGSAYSVTGTTEGPLASIREVLPSLHGSYSMSVANDGNGWWSYTVNGHNLGQLYFGDGGSIGRTGASWLEDFANNGSTFVHPGLSQVDITPTTALHGVTAYSDVPDTNIWTSGQTVHFVTGGNTARCFMQGQVASGS